MPFYAIEAQSGGGKTAVLAALAELNQVVKPAPPPEDDTPDACVALAIHAFERFHAATSGFCEESPPVVADQCRTWADSYPEYSKSFLAVAALLDSCSNAEAHIVLDQLHDESVLDSRPIIRIEVDEKTPQEIAKEILTRLHPQQNMFL